ncbi:MAG: hypothetical protein U0900_19045 [Myxococcota bacterium]
MRESVESLLPALLGLEAELRFASSSLATATLVVLLLCATREGLAQNGAAGGGVGRGNTANVLVTNPSVDAAQVPMALDRSTIRHGRELDALLAVRGGPAPFTARQTDAAIAAAVARGQAKELEKKSGFRKKNSDLLRTQRAVQIAHRDMVVRLRLRPKTRNAVGVELRF